MPDCPELDDDICDECLFRRALSERFDMIDGLIISALETKPLKEHPHRRANELLHAAIRELDELWDDLVDDETFRSIEWP